MTISVLIPWRDRDHLRLTLRQNARHFDACHEVLILNGGGDLETLMALIEQSGCSTARVVSIDGMREFNKSACLNVGASLIQGDGLFVLDADIVLLDDSVRDMARALASGSCFVVMSTVVESDPTLDIGRWNAASFIRTRTTATELVGRNGHRASVDFTIGNDGTRSGAGLMLVNLEHFKAVQGFNSNLRGWGFEDVDLQIRLQLGPGLTRLRAGRARHFSHRRARDVDESLARNAANCYANYERGDLDGTLSADVDRWRDRTSLIEWSRPVVPQATGAATPS